MNPLRSSPNGPLQAVAEGSQFFWGKSGIVRDCNDFIGPGFAIGGLPKVAGKVVAVVLLHARFDSDPLVGC
jgi:hypothetical protein